ncbi:Signal transduction histidine kinase, glucose-6-phosphate specific [Lysobacter dokdonensis DS-58]|uniref:Signal transduction histidine kinase, glucose-6-phosphate specific n=1 Tax=Lysobacter dokdonensis DS-58 TaxID=1300345 RepID=A0A0A2X4T4_9GAMM|nr:MASE1 domain-containing protein [Lysobacter dokdonensis]KGQ20234.1 Signal transduction histidine kinase, glucose-6-phosphate specific [Lysobacter dokdonensis DS-58]
MRTKSERGTRIETRRAAQRPARWLLPVGYVVAYVVLFSLSSVYWFLPAGMRLAALWLSNRRDWWLLALADMTAIYGVATYRGVFESQATLLAAAVIPWCIYALVVHRFARAPGPAPTPESMMRFLLCGIGASFSVALVLTTVNAIDDGIPARPVTAFVNFALGDFIGILLLAPIIRLINAQLRGAREPWSKIFAYGLVLAPAALAVGLSMLPVERAEIYPVIFASFMLFWIAHRFGWRAGAVSLLLLSASAYAFSEDVFRLWQPVHLQSMLAAAGFATLTLGMSADALRRQGQALKASIDMLSTRTRALADTANRLVSQQEEERRRIGAELHDQLGQDMTAIATRLRLLARTTDSPEVRDGLRSIDALVGNAHEHLRATIQSLHPLVLERFGLSRALAAGPMATLAKEHDIDYQCHIDGDVDVLPQETAAAIYRICQEAVTNAARHGCGGRLRIDLSVHHHLVASDVTLRIEDDAGPFDIPMGNTGHGLQNIYDRADAMGANYDFDPESGHPRHMLEVRVKLAEGVQPRE